MKKLIFLLSLALFLTSSVPALAATTAAKASVKVVAKVAPKVPVKKVVAKKPVAKKAVASTAKNPVFSPAAAALAMNVPGGEAYQNALRQAEKDCIAAKGNKEKLAACDQEFRDAQLLLGQ